jgi:5,5'-dehydrodivanillate O-demethylase
MVIPCNWLQVMENLMDPMHVECLHRDYFAYVLERQGGPQLQEFLTQYAPSSMKKFAFDLFEDGIIERHVTGTDHDSTWRAGTPTFFPTISILGHAKTGSVIFVVPLDDTHTWFLEQIANRPGAVPGSTDSNHFHEVSGVDREGRFITNTANGQDYMVAVTQGDIAHREDERLATSDLGIVLYRQLLSRQIDQMEQGHDPINVHRTGSENRVVELPQIAAHPAGAQSARQTKRARHHQHDLVRQSSSAQPEFAPAWLAAAPSGPHAQASGHYEVVLGPPPPR